MHIYILTVKNNTICSSPVQDWVQDSIQRLNKRKTTEKTDQIDFDNTYFCLKKEQAEYFCIKQP